MPYRRKVLSKLLLKAVNITVLGAFLFNIVFVDFGLAESILANKNSLQVWTATERPLTNREMLADLYRKNRLIWIANSSSRYGKLLDEHKANALLLSSGRYLMKKETADNALSLIRAICHEDFEVLMQVEARERPTRYRRLMERLMQDETAMRLYKPLSEYAGIADVPKNSIFNDLIAKAFEIITMVDEDLGFETELSKEERAFEAYMRPILAAKDFAGRYKNFSKVFFDRTKRLKTVRRLQRDPGVRFRKAASSPGAGPKVSANGIVIPTGLIKDIADGSGKTRIIYNKDEMLGVRLEKVSAERVKGSVADRDEPIELDFTTVKISSDKKSVPVKSGFAAELGKTHPYFDRMIVLVDAKHFKAAKYHPVLPYLYLVPHEFYSFAGKFYVYVVEKEPLERLEYFMRKRKELASAPPPVPQRKIYTDAVLDESGTTVVYGNFMPVTTKNILPKTDRIPVKTIQEHPDCVVTGGIIDGRGHHSMADEPIVQNRQDLAGQEILVVYSGGEKKRIKTVSGELVYEQPREDSRNAVYTGCVIKDGKVEGGTFVTAYPKYLAKETLGPYAEAFIRNVKFGPRGGLDLAGQFFWKSRPGYENYDKSVAVWKDGKFSCIYDAEGNLLWAADPRELGPDVKLVYVGAEYVDGEIHGGEVVFGSSRGVTQTILDQYPDCIITNLSGSPQQGTVYIAGNRSIGTNPSLRGATGIVAIRRDGRTAAIYDKNGNLQYSNAPDSKNAVFLSSELKNDKFVWHDFIAAFENGVPEEMPALLPSCAVANVEANGVGDITVANRIVIQKRRDLIGRKDLAVIFRQGEPVAISDLEGNIISVVDEEGMTGMELDRIRLTIGEETILELVENFGIVRAFSIISRISGISTKRLGRIMWKYARVLNEKEREGLKGEKGEAPEFFARTREVFGKLRLDTNNVEWLTSILRDYVYRFIVNADTFLEMLRAEARDTKNPPYLRAAYKKVAEYYARAAAFKPAVKLKKKLFLFQKDGVRFVLERKRAILADECGLGKTLQAVAAAFSCKKGGAKKILIISPKNAMGWWREEILSSTYLRPEDVYLTGSRHDPKALEGARVVVVNYEAIRRRGGKVNLLKERLLGAGFDFIIIDEAHQMRNETLQTEAILELKAEYKLLVTATPLVGRDPAKLFNLLHWLYPETFTSVGEFKRLYARNPFLLRSMLDGIMLARSKADVAGDLPERRIIDRAVPLQGRHAEAYRELDANFARWLEKRGVSHKKGMVLSKLEKLRQVAISPTFVSGGNPGQFTDEDMPAKYRETLNLAGSGLMQKEKVVIFSRYVGVVKELTELLERAHPGKVLSLTGEIKSMKKRTDILNRFNTSSSPMILVATYGVAGQSLNLQAASRVISVDCPWTYQEFLQAMDRVHRFGQTKPVTIYRLMAEDTVDELIVRVLTESEYMHRFIMNRPSETIEDEKTIIMALARQYRLPGEKISERQQAFRTRIAKRKRPPSESQKEPQEEGWIEFEGFGRVHTTVARKIRFSVSEIDVFNRIGEASFKKYRVLSDEEACMVEDVLAGNDEPALVAKYYGRWEQLLKSAMLKLGARAIEELGAKFEEYKKDFGRENERVSEADRVFVDMVMRDFDIGEYTAEEVVSVFNRLSVGYSKKRAAAVIELLHDGKEADSIIKKDIRDKERNIGSVSHASTRKNNRGEAVKRLKNYQVTGVPVGKENIRASANDGAAVRERFEEDAKTFGGKGAWDKMVEEWAAEIGYGTVPSAYITIQEVWNKFIEANAELVERGNRLIQADTAAGGTVSENTLKKLGKMRHAFGFTEELEKLVIARAEKVQELKGWIIDRSSGRWEDSFLRNLAGVFISPKRRDEKLIIQGIKTIFKDVIYRIWVDQNSGRKIDGVPNLLDKDEGLGVLIQPFLSFDASGTAMSNMYNHTVIEAVIGDADTAVRPVRANMCQFLFKKGRHGSFEYNPSFLEMPYEFTLRGKEYNADENADEMRELIKGYPKRRGKFSPLSAAQAKELNRVVNALEEKAGVSLDVEWGFLGGKLYIIQIRPIIGDFNKPLAGRSGALKKKTPIATTPIARGGTAPEGFTGKIVYFGRWIDRETVEKFEKEFGNGYIRVQDDVASHVLGVTTKAKVLVDLIQGSAQAHNINLITGRIADGEFVYANGPVLTAGFERHLKFIPHPEFKGVWISTEDVTYFGSGLRGRFYSAAKASKAAPVTDGAESPRKLSQVLEAEERRFRERRETPKPDEARAKTPEWPPEKPRYPEKMRILIVDDTAENRDKIKRHLEEVLGTEEYEFLFAGESEAGSLGSSAMGLINAGAADYIIADLQIGAAGEDSEIIRNAQLEETIKGIFVISAHPFVDFEEYTTKIDNARSEWNLDRCIKDRHMANAIIKCRRQQFESYDAELTAWYVAHPEVPRPEEGRFRILIAEDDQERRGDIERDLKEILGTDEYEIIPVSGPDEAVSFIKKGDINYVVSDIEFGGHWADEEIFGAGQKSEAVTGMFVVSTGSYEENFRKAYPKCVNDKPLNPRTNRDDMSVLTVSVRACHERYHKEHAAERSAWEAAHPKPKYPGKLRVLYWDDEHARYPHVKKYLESLGNDEYDMRVEFGGDFAPGEYDLFKNGLETENYDLIIIDAYIEGLTECGDSVVELIKRMRAKNNNLRLVVLTALLTVEIDNSFRSICPDVEFWTSFTNKDIFTSKVRDFRREQLESRDTALTAWYVAHPEVPRPVEPEKLTVLWVEDDPEEISGVKQKMRTAFSEDPGYEIIYAQNMKEAVEKMGETKFDVAVFDIEIAEDKECSSRYYNGLAAIPKLHAVTLGEIYLAIDVKALSSTGRISEIKIINKRSGGAFIARALRDVSGSYAYVEPLVTDFRRYRKQQIDTHDAENRAWEAAHPKPERPRKTTVLVVEDDPDLMHLYKRKLSVLGDEQYDIVYAGNLQEAVKAAEDNDMHMMIFDPNAFLEGRFGPFEGSVFDTPDPAKLMETLSEHSGSLAMSIGIGGRSSDHYRQFDLFQEGVFRTLRGFYDRNEIDDEDILSFIRQCAEERYKSYDRALTAWYASHPEIGRPDEKKVRILLMDKAGNRAETESRLREMLGEENYEIVNAKTCEDAVKAAGDRDFDAAIFHFSLIYYEEEERLIATFKQMFTGIPSIFIITGMPMPDNVPYTEGSERSAERQLISYRREAVRENLGDEVAKKAHIYDEPYSKSLAQEFPLMDTMPEIVYGLRKLYEQCNEERHAERCAWEAAHPKPKYPGKMRVLIMDDYQPSINRFRKSLESAMDSNLFDISYAHNRDEVTRVINGGKLDAVFVDVNFEDIGILSNPLFREVPDVVAYSDRSAEDIKMILLRHEYDTIRDRAHAIHKDFDASSKFASLLQQFRQEQIKSYESVLTAWYVAHPEIPQPNEPGKMEMIWLDDESMAGMWITYARMSGELGGDEYGLHYVSNYSKAIEMLEGNDNIYAIVIDLNLLKNGSKARREVFDKLLHKIPHIIIVTGFRQDAEEDLRQCKLDSDILARLTPILDSTTTIDWVALMRMFKRQQLETHDAENRAWEAAHPGGVVVKKELAKPKGEVLFIADSSSERAEALEEYLNKRFPGRFSITRVNAVWELERALKSKTPAVVITDAVLDGSEKIDEIIAKVCEKNPAAKFIVTSEEAAIMPKDRFEGLNVLGVLESPFYFAGVADIFRRQAVADRLESGMKQVKEAFISLAKSVRKSVLNTSISSLNGVSQRTTDAAALHLCVPVEVLKNSADMTLALQKLGLLNKGDTKFELVVTGVTKDDLGVIEGLNRDDVREALNLPKNLNVTTITEDEIRARTDALGRDGADPAIRTGVIKDLYLEELGFQALPDGEYLAIATDAVGEAAAKDLEAKLNTELADNVSIRVMTRPEAGRSVFSLSNVINGWLKSIQEGHKSTICILPPVMLAEEMLRALEEAVRSAWQVLVAA